MTRHASVGVALGVASVAAFGTAAAQNMAVISYSPKHTRLSASFEDVKDVKLRSLPKKDSSEGSFAASTLWKENPAVIVVMRRPG